MHFNIRNEIPRYAKVIKDLWNFFILDNTFPDILKVTICIPYNAITSRVNRRSFFNLAVILYIKELIVNFEPFECAL